MPGLSSEEQKQASDIFKEIQKEMKIEGDEAEDPSKLLEEMMKGMSAEGTSSGADNPFL